MGNFWTDLDLAYKFTLVFLGLMVLTISAGFIKVLVNRRRLQGFIKQDQLEAGRKEDTVELTQREKDEGDLFGIRAIEAGFFAGVAQSRPTSRAGSMVDLPSASSRTLLGGANSPLMKNNMANNSALSLNLGGSNRDSETLPDNGSRRAPSPASKLRPSDAELNGRHNLSGTAVDMNLNVPPSPGYRTSQTASFGGFDDGASDGFTSPQTMSPTISNFNPRQYTPVSTTLASPGGPPETRLPTLPGTALRKESRSPSPQQYPQVRVEQPHSDLKNPSVVRLQPQAYHSATQHQRDGSGTSSVYTENRLSSYAVYQNYSERSLSAASSNSHNQSLSSPDNSGHTSIVLSAAGDQDAVAPVQFTSHLSTYLNVGPDAGKDARLSEFYDAYYRNSQLNLAQAINAIPSVNIQSTIVEVDSPLPSPNPHQTHFGVAK